MHQKYFKDLLEKDTLKNAPRNPGLGKPWMKLLDEEGENSTTKLPVPQIAGQGRCAGPPSPAGFAVPNWVKTEDTQNDKLIKYLEKRD